MAENTILSSDLFRNLVLPFLLLFAVVFAILEKTKILGDDKRQVNAIVSLVIALVTITFATAVNIINLLIPFLAVSIIIILVFLLLLGFVASDAKEGLKLTKGIKITLGIIISIAVIIAVLFATGSWDFVFGYLSTKGQNSNLVANVIFIVVIVVAIIVVLSGGKKGSDK